MVEKIFALIVLFALTYFMERFMFGDLKKIRKPTREEYFGQYILALIFTFLALIFTFILCVFAYGIFGWILGA